MSRTLKSPETAPNIIALVIRSLSLGEALNCDSNMMRDTTLLDTSVHMHILYSSIMYGHLYKYYSFHTYCSPCSYIITMDKLYWKYSNIWPYFPGHVCILYDLFLFRKMRRRKLRSTRQLPISSEYAQNIPYWTSNVICSCKRVCQVSTDKYWLSLWWGWWIFFIRINKLARVLVL